MSTSPPSDVVRTSKLHDALRHALYLVPKGRSEIFSILRKNFPFKRARTSEQKHYVKQLLLILTYSPTLRRDVWGLIIHKCIEVDVEIKIYSGGGVKVVEEHGEGEEEDDTMFEIDGFTGEATEDARKCREGKEKRKRADSIGADEYADKLDEMLDLLIEDVNGLGDKGECYKCLEDVFEGCVVKTHKSKFTQFVWFVVCKMEADRKAAEARETGRMTTTTTIGFAGSLLVTSYRTHYHTLTPAYTVSPPPATSRRLCPGLCSWTSRRRGRSLRD